MGINRDMKPYILQKNIPERSPSGALKCNWVDECRIDVAVHKKNDMRITASEKYMESTHTGLTHCKRIKAGVYRLLGTDAIYEITDCNTEGRLTNLILKVVDADAG